jgi:hypothetical protein
MMTNSVKLTFGSVGLAAALAAGLSIAPAAAAPRGSAQKASATASQDLSARSRESRTYQRRHVSRRVPNRGIVGDAAGAVVGAATAPLWGFGGEPYYDDRQAYSGPGYEVAPVVRTPHAPYYAFNRYSGQTYGSCVIDLGYGRTQPCDAGGR